MEQIYAQQITYIEFVQDSFAGWSGYFELINNVSNPHFGLRYLVPLVSMFDSVFGLQLLLVLAYGGWLNSVLTWWFFEDRPYWWVRRSKLYTCENRPLLEQTEQTCETGLGNPSRHSITAASVLILFIMWFSHILHERKWNIRWWKWFVYPLFVTALGLVMLAQVFVSMHFPHQCLVGTLLGVVVPTLSVRLSAPYLWHADPRLASTDDTLLHGPSGVLRATILTNLSTYFVCNSVGRSALYSVRQAIRACEYPDSLSISSTPLYLGVEVGAMLVAAASYKSDVVKYRYFTKDRSILISIFGTVASIYVFQKVQEYLKLLDKLYHAMLFCVNTLQYDLYLKWLPALAMWSYERVKDKIQ